ncbi:protein phosphatase 2C domain-containing protein [Acidobacteriota bacterium]
MQIEAFGHTDIGKKRQFNEDNYLCLELSSQSSNNSAPHYLLAVADGIGGHAGGELASTLAINTLRETILIHRKRGDLHLKPQELLVDSYQKANQGIFQLATEDERLVGMGTTLVAALITGNEVTISNVGDSRAYLFRNGQISQITLDHSWKAEQQRSNALSEKEILSSPFKNMITRSLGFEADVEIDTFHTDLFNDDYLLLCTDGLYDSIPVTKILKLLKKSEKA